MTTTHHPAQQRRACPHQPPCPAADSDRAVRAASISGHPEQGWHLLCNGIVCFDDGGAILPDGRTLDISRH